MSNNVDNRVVQMDFDNAKFERGVRTTLESLTKLKRELDMSKSVKSMEKLSEGSINLKGIEDGIDRLTRKFSTASQIWSTIVSRATNAAITKFTGAINQIKTGGMTRAANIEQANFMLEGLLASKYKTEEKRAAKLQEISDAAMKSVDGTAYGYDEASKAAAQFFASGITDGAKMEATLAGVAGVAAMTGRDYGDIAHIFTTVSGQGRVMGEQLNQLAASGINAAATLGDYLHVSEKEVREMTSKGEIDFQTFAAAMSSAFGEHAKAANKTFNGALSNMKAAMNRIGAEFYTPYRQYMRDIFNAFTPVLNATKKILTPVITLYDKGFKHISQHVVNFLGLFAKNGKDGATGFLVTFGERMQVVTRSFEKMKGFYSLFVGIKNIIRRIGDLLMPVGMAFNQVFGIGEKATGFWRNISAYEKGLKRTKKIVKEFKKDIGKDSIYAGITKGYDLADLARRFKDFTKSIKFSDETLVNLKDTFAGLFAVVDIFAQIIGAVFHMIAPGAKTVGGLADAILAITGSIGRFLVEVDMLLKETGALNAISYVVGGIINAISSALSFLLKIFAKVVTYVSLFSDSYVGQLVSALGQIHDWLVKIASTKIAPTLKEIASGFGEVIKQFATFARNKIAANGFNLLPDGMHFSFKSLFGFAEHELGKAATGLKEFVSALNIPEKAGTAFGKVIYKLMELKRIGISGMLEKIKSIKLSTITNAVGSGMTAMGKGLKTFGENAKDFYDKKLSDRLGKAGEGLKSFSKSIASSISKSTAKTLSNFAKSISTFFAGIGKTVGGKVGKTIDTLVKIGKSLGKFAKSISKDDFIGAISGLASAIVLFNQLKQMKKKTKDAKSLVEEMKGVFSSISSTISSYKKDKIAKPVAFKNIAQGVLMLAGALYIVSKVDSKKILPSLGVLGVLAAGMIAVAVIADKVIKEGAGFVKLAKSVTPIAASMLLIAEAFKEFAKVKKDSVRTASEVMLASFMALSVLMAVIGNFADDANGFGDAAYILAMGVTMKALGTAMMSIAEAAKTFSTIKKEQMIMAGAVIAGLIGMMSIFALAVNAFSGGAYIMTAAIGMIALAKAVDMFAQLISKYANIDFKAIWKGALYVGLLMTAAGAWAAVVGKFAKYAIRGAASIYILSGGLVALATAMKIVGAIKINWTAWLKVPAMLAIMAVFIAAISNVSKRLLRSSVGILVLSSAMVVLAKAFSELAGVPVVSMIGQMIVLTSTLTALAFIAAALGKGKLLVGSAGILMIATAMAVLATSLGLVAAIPVNGLIKGILGLAACLGALIVVLGIAGTVAGPGLILIGLGLALVGVGVAALTWGLKQLIPLLGMFLVLPQEVIDKGLLIFDKILTSIAKSLAKFSVGVLALGAAVLVLAIALAIGAAAVKKLGQSLLWVAGGIAAIAASIWLLSKVTGMSFSEMVNAVGQAVVRIYEFIKNLVINIINAIKECISAAVGYVGGATTGIVDFFKRMALAVVEFYTTAFSNFLSSIPIIGDELAEKFDGWSKGIKDKLSSKEGEEAGAEAPKSVAKGIEDNKKPVEDAVDSIGGDKGILGSFKELAATQGEGGATNFMDSFSGVLSDSPIDPANLMSGDILGDFGELGTGSADAFGGNFQDALGGFGVDASNLGVTAADTASQPKEMKKSAKSNVDAYTGMLSGKNSAKKAEEAGKVLGTKSADGSENKKGMKDAGADNAKGFASGVASPDALKAAYNAGWKLGKKSEEGERDASKSKSPSRVFIELGKYLSQGLAIGITRYSDLARNAAYDMTEGTADSVKDLLTRVVSVINDDYDFDPTIRPVLDLSDVKNGASEMSSILSSGPFGLSVPSAGIRLAENISADIQNGGKSDMAASINRLAKRLEIVTDTMNSRQMINNFQVDGASDPEAFANAVSDRLKLKARAV